MKNNKSINDITLFRYLFNLDNRDLPQSILNWYSKVGSVVDSDRENAIRELSKIKGNCRNLVIFSKTFIDTMDKSYMKFTQFHMDILNELDDADYIRQGNRPSRSKSVYITESGVERARELLAKYSIDDWKQG